MGSLLIVVWLYGVAVWNLPESDRRDAWREPIEPMVEALGLRQGWGVFAPNPTRTTHVTQGRIIFHDGHVEVFEAPHPGPWIGSTRSERWRKWETRAFDDGYSSLRLPTARWLADRYGGADQIAEVELVHVTSASPDPLTDEPRSWQAERYYRYDPATGRGRSVSEEPTEVAGP